MNETSELFATLTSCLEDVHGIAVEGQSSDQPLEMLNILAEQACNGLQRCNALLDQIKSRTDTP